MCTFLLCQWEFQLEKQLKAACFELYNLLHLKLYKRTKRIDYVQLSTESRLCNDTVFVIKMVIICYIRWSMAVEIYREFFLLTKILYGIMWKNKSKYKKNYLWCYASAIYSFMQSFQIFKILRNCCLWNFYITFGGDFCKLLELGLRYILMIYLNFST